MTVQNEATTTGVILTDTAAAKVGALLEQEGRDDLRLRIAVQPGGCSGLRYQLYFDEREMDGDIDAEFSGVHVVTDKMSAPVPDGRDHRLRGHDREAGLHDRQPERHRILRLRRLVPLIVRGPVLVRGDNPPDAPTLAGSASTRLRRAPPRPADKWWYRSAHGLKRWYSSSTLQQHGREGNLPAVLLSAAPDIA